MENAIVQIVQLNVLNIKIKKKSNPYFYKNKQDEVDLSFK